MRCTVGPTGIGRVMGDRRSRMAGGRRAGSSNIATRVRRGFTALHPRTRFADAPAAAGKLSCLLRDLPVEEDLRLRIALLRAALYASALTYVDRLSRYSRRIHACARQRLLPEHQACDVRAAGIRDPQSHELRRLRRTLLGIHGMRRPRLDETDGERHRTRVLRLCRSGGSVGPDDGTVAPWVVVASRRLRPKSLFRPCSTLREWIWA